MENKYVLDPLSAARLLTVMTLEKADRAFPRQRRTMERLYRLPNGTFASV